LRRDLLARIELAARDDDVRPRAGEAERHRAAEAAAAPGHQRDLAAQVEEPRGLDVRRAARPRSPFRSVHDASFPFSAVLRAPQFLRGATGRPTSQEAEAAATHSSASQANPQARSSRSPETDASLATRVTTRTPFARLAKREMLASGGLPRGARCARGSKVDRRRST